MQAAARAALRQQAASRPSSEDAAHNAAFLYPQGELPKCYAVLGLERTATERDITRAYRLAAAKWHPDKWLTASPEEQQTAAARFRELQVAYEELGQAS
jgi:DnaJ-class molecular chaperone